MMRWLANKETPQSDIYVTPGLISYCNFAHFRPVGVHDENNDYGTPDGVTNIQYMSLQCHICNSSG